MKRFGTDVAPADKANIIVENDVRISVLSNNIIRVESDKEGVFEDRQTQTVVCRNFAKPQFTYQKNGDKASISTKSHVFYVDLRSLKTCVVTDGKTVYPSNRKNLGGTARTLDGNLGVLGSWKGKFEKKDHFFLGHFRKGIFASDGVSEMDDSKSFLLNLDGSVSPRRKDVKDKYILAFGDDYLDGLMEFYALCGYTPLLPKFALGNWWSRYHAYSDKEYIALMDEFAKRDIPFTVATIDMDWHIVKNVPKDAEYRSFQGAGWTGYTFEKQLFPNYKKFLKDLKDRGLAVTMNLHPRDGVRYFEEQYPKMAQACGIDPNTKKTVEFDLTDPKFVSAYFDILHHPYERDGVDFWWIDWQQGTKSKMKGLDPLWMLNHYHFIDNCRDNNKGLILSRYAGLGSHRYPLGFSGDTLVTWSSLRFQPYFTALASNAGYTWWSHDIGGHMLNHGDQELYLRWVQLGAFSPINRLHSNNKCMSKEPWNYPKVENIAVEYLRLRHRMLPLLYSANVRTAKDGVPIVCPMYYFDKHENSYSKTYRTQFYFAQQLLVAPIVRPSKGGESKINVWLPQGVWFDFFTGKAFAGGKVHALSYDLEGYPVFAKSGAIIPLLEKMSGNSQEFDELEIRVYPGNGVYTMFDEIGSIRFEISQKGEGYVLDITPDESIKTKRLNIVLTCEKDYRAVCKDATGETRNSIAIDCKPCRIEFIAADLSSQVLS